MESSKRLLRTDKFELMQWHNVGSATHDYSLVKEWKAQGLCKYHGMTTTSDGAYDAFEQVMIREKPDFIQVDYAIDNRNVETRILPAAQANGAAVLCALPFGRERLFARTANVPLPDFARDVGAATWAQFFLKWLISHPAVTVVIPGTDKPEYVADNQGAARGPMPDTAMRARMAAFIDALPPAAAPAGRGGGRGPGGGGRGPGG
jgi:aryl-alcohol dehydrogenase-like predicted oxidoreductase